MSSIIIRPAVEEQMRQERMREEARTREFTHPSWHSEEAKEAWRNRKPQPGGILLPLDRSDWFAMGYDAARKQSGAVTRFDDDWD